MGCGVEPGGMGSRRAWEKGQKEDIEDGGELYESLEVQTWRKRRRDRGKDGESLQGCLETIDLEEEEEQRDG